MMFNLLYPNCKVVYPHQIGNGACDGEGYNISECGFEEGDCCDVEHEDLIGNGLCDRRGHNMASFLFDEGDFNECNKSSTTTAENT